MPAGRARIVWAASLDPAVIVVEAKPAASGDDQFDAAALAAAAVHVRSSQMEHVCYDLGQGINARLDVIVGTLCAGPVRLVYRLNGIERAQRQLSKLAHFLSYVRRGRVSGRLTLPDPRFARLVLALRVYDALTDGASQRDIAVMLFGADRVDADWRAQSDALLSRTRRLSALARHLASGGWRDLLSG